MKVIVTLCFLFLVLSISAQNPEKGGDCMHYTARAWPEPYELGFSSPLFSCHVYGAWGNPILIEDDIKIRPGDFVRISFRTCGNDPIVHFDFPPDSIQYQFITGVATFSELVSSHSGFYEYRMKFEEDAELLIPTFHPFSKLTGEFIQLNVKVVQEEIDPTPTNSLAPFIYQNENTVFVHSNNGELGTLTVLSSNGKTLLSFPMEESAEVDISSYASGMYFFVLNVNGDISRGKAMKY